MIPLNELILRTMDVPLGWTLALPRSLTIVALSVLTAAILVGVRRIATDQDLLERCSRDKERLRILTKLARRSNDKEALGRYRTTGSMIAMVKARSEIKPLLVSLLPVALLATWAFQRVAYVPLRAGTDVVVTAYLPVSAEGRLMHLVPMEGVECPSGWVQQTRVVQQGGQAYSQAQWTLLAAPADRPYVLTFRYAGATYHKPVRVGQPIYEPPVQTYDDTEVLTIETHMEECRLFGVIGGITWIGLPPWLAAYFLVSIPAMLLLKRVLRVR